MQGRSLDLEEVSYWLRCPSVCQQASVHSFRKRRGCGMRLVESKRAESGEFRTMTPAFCPLLGLIYCTRSTALGLLFTNTCSHHISEQRGVWPNTNKLPLRLILHANSCNSCIFRLQQKQLYWKINHDRNIRNAQQ